MRPPNVMAEIPEYLIGLGRATRETIIPCSSAEVSDIASALDTDRLPAQYAEFLLLMGRRAGDLLRGSDFFYPHMVDLLDEARQLIVENNAVPLMRPGSIVIGMHQGYQVYWLESGEPSGRVQLFEETDDSIRQSWPTLLDFLVDQTSEELRISRKYGQ